MIVGPVVLLIPFIGLLLFACIGRARSIGYWNLIFSCLTFSASSALTVFFLSQNKTLFFFHQQFMIDSFNLCLIDLTTFIFMTVAYFSLHYMHHHVREERIHKAHLHLYYVMYQTFCFTLLLALSTNNIGILWVALEGATLATVLLVSLYRTPEAIEAAWKYFILCIVGIALALFGTILVYFSAKSAIIDNNEALLWSVLFQHASLLDANVIHIAFVFLLIGYGTKIGLVPMHYWLPDAHSESPAPMSALLSGLLLNVGLYALVRFKMLVDPVLERHTAGNLMMVFGLISFLVACLFLYRQRNIKRLFSYSSIEHMGLITFAFGANSSLATFAALFYMMMHSLIKSGLFMTVGYVIQLMKTQDMEKIRGLIQVQPLLGWSLLIGTLAISGLPPFGIFNCEVMLVASIISSHLVLSMILIIGFLLGLGGLLKHIQPMVYGQPRPEEAPIRIYFLPIGLHLTLALVLALYIPPFFYRLLVQATSLISGNPL